MADLCVLRAFVPGARREALELFAPKPAHRWAFDYHWGDEGQIANPPTEIGSTHKCGWAPCPKTRRPPSTRS